MPPSVVKPLFVVAVVEWQGEVINVEFDRNRVTLNWVARVQAALDGGDANEFSRAAAEVIHGWDLLDADGVTPYPPTVENIGELPASLLGELFASIQEAGAPGAAEGNASANTSSSPTEDSNNAQAIHRNGGLHSPSPTPSASALTR